jgi:hypothetical protein
MYAIKPARANEADEHAAFEELCGGPSRAFKLLHIYKDSYPSGTELDRLYGLGKSKVEVFKAKARREGFNDEQVAAFLRLQ